MKFVMEYHIVRVQAIVRGMLVRNLIRNIISKLRQELYQLQQNIHKLSHVRLRHTTLINELMNRQRARNDEWSDTYVQEPLPVFTMSEE